MLTDGDGNDGDNKLPFADFEIPTDVHLDLPIPEKSKHHHHKTRAKRNPAKQQPNATDQNFRYTPPHLYFENTTEENNFLSFIPYTGPSNTSHLGRSLYLPQLISNDTNDLNLGFNRFIREYDDAINSFKSSTTTTMSLSIYLRFGILYIISPSSKLNQTMSIQDFTDHRTRGKDIKTAFYTCKGVTSPKRLITAITKHNYHQILSNKYSYDIQLFGPKSNQYPTLHFRYNEQLQCTSILYRADFPENFDFIRNKTLSRFRSIDNSYSDIFDFRVQLVQYKILSKVDPDVLDTLRGIPVDEVLYIDPSTHILHVSTKLRRFVKYLKCTRSSDYQNIDENVTISMGIYEEFQLNENGQCESLMKASNTMTIELLDVVNIPSGKKLYDIGMWFSTLCQTCVDLPTKIIAEHKPSKWFPDVLAKKSNRSVKEINVNELTTYKTNKSKERYTNEELTLVKRILREENLRNLLLDSNEEKEYDRKEIEQRYENITKLLKTSAVPSAHEALQKIEQAYQTICKEFIQS